jgi:hypothetical protein
MLFTILEDIPFDLLSIVIVVGKGIMHLREGEVREFRNKFLGGEAMSKHIDHDTANWKARAADDSASTAYCGISRDMRVRNFGHDVLPGGTNLNKPTEHRQAKAPKGHAAYARPAVLLFKPRKSSGLSTLVGVELARHGRASPAQALRISSASARPEPPQFATQPRPCLTLRLL